MKDRFPVSVIIERRSYPDKAWMVDSWSAIGVLPVETQATSVSCSSIYQSEDSEQFLYEGYCIELFQDDAESYYANLTGRNPGVFVICEHEEDEDGDEEEGGTFRPLLVTLSYDEMASYIEVDTPVFDLPIPPPVYDWVEEWVLDNYQPEKKHKRARQKWADNTWKPLRRPVGS